MNKAKNLLLIILCLTPVVSQCMQLELDPSAKINHFKNAILEVYEAQLINGEKLIARKFLSGQLKGWVECKNYKSEDNEDVTIYDQECFYTLADLFEQARQSVEKKQAN